MIWDETKEVVIPRVRCKTNKKTCMTCEDMRLEKMSSVNLRSLLETHSIENISKELKELYKRHQETLQSFGENLRNDMRKDLDHFKNEIQTCDWRNGGSGE